MNHSTADYKYVQLVMQGKDIMREVAVSLLNYK